MDKQTGWKPTPLALKILVGLFILWSIGAIFNMPNLYTSGLPLLGVYVYGLVAVLVAFILDIVGPLTFIYALWNRKTWGLHGHFLILAYLF